MKESKYSEKVTKFLISKGAVVDNNTASILSRVGRSDLTALYKGKYLALELKTGNYKPSDLQILYLDKIRKAGGYGLILRDDLKEIKKVLLYIDKNKEYKQPPLPKYNDLKIIFD